MQFRNWHAEIFIEREISCERGSHKLEEKIVLNGDGSVTTLCFWCPECQIEFKGNKYKKHYSEPTKIPIETIKKLWESRKTKAALD